ncbi:RrF2 family transcriptional regulator [bacterium]|nr:RrF2 family transcriptional regulator [bacterium]
MKISTKGRYALRMLLDLAMHQDSGYVPLKDISKRQKISKKYLEQIVPIFNKNNFLQTNRGFQGGYRLTLSPDKYTVGDILRLAEGSLSPVPCLESNCCSDIDNCLTYPVWKGLERVINEYLDSISLQDIIDNQKDNFVNNYVI